MLKRDLRFIGMNKRKEISAALLGISVAVILWVTVLGRDSYIENSLVFEPFHAFYSFVKDIQDGRLRISGNFIGNIILFIPVGVLFPLTGDEHKCVKTGFVALCFSIIIEIIQLVSHRGYFEVDDLILNTLGAVMGYGIYRVAMKLFTKNDLNATGI